MVDGVRAASCVGISCPDGRGLRIITYVLLCGYSPFRSDDTNELIRETTAARVEFHERYWSNISSEGMWHCLHTLVSRSHANACHFL